MDFFGAQDDARRNTWRLALLFGGALVTLIVLTNLLVAAVYAWSADGGRFGTDVSTRLANLPAGYWIWISAAVVGAVALASGYRYLQVRSGGRAVAESLSGRLLSQSTTDYRERRLLNVVEEMAIASGIPVPPVYIIDESSINAFAAGFGPDDAVIGVNQGTIDHLTRDELQGVIGHEFSHLLNGDSRINLRLIAVLYGILFIGLVGRGLLYGVGSSRPRRGRSNGGAPILVLALGMMVIGYGGIFFGNLIKAAVSRQREYLADAASVQFTRNPGGIAGALKKIGGLAAGSTMRSASAREMSHIFFGQAQRFLLAGLMSTHPPLEKRIRAVDPRWDGQFPQVADEPMQESAADRAAAFATGAAAATALTAQAVPAAADRIGTGEQSLEVRASADQVVNAVGRLDQAGLDGAAVLLGRLPEPLRHAAHDPFAARAMLYALVLDTPAEIRREQLALVDRQAERGVAEELARLAPLIDNLDEQHKLTLIEMAMPALKELSDGQYRTFVGNLVALIKADHRIDLMEWVLHRLLVKQLKPHFEGLERLPVRYARVSSVAAEAGVLVSALARVGGRSPDADRTAFAAGMETLGLEGTFDAEDDPNFSRLNQALAELRTLRPLAKPRLLKACAAAVLADGQVSAREGALLKGIAATLDCPLPPSIYRG